MLGSWLRNVETMVNVNESDVEKEKEIYILLEDNLLPSKGEAPKLSGI